VDRKTKWLFAAGVLIAVAGIGTAGDVGKDPFTPAQRRFWAFQPVKRVDPPAVKNSAWIANPVDRFVLAKLEAKSLAPAKPADRITLLRRLSFDLVGLPPTPAEIDAFVADASPSAYEKVVDRLLASNHYGERWARHWLDLARYAESEGFKADETRPNAWRYRDYLINAFNSNKPYDRFVREQIAGDELWPQSPEARVATGFLRHYPDESNARNLMQRRQEILDDVTDTVGATFLAMTYGCARCHTHKFDPILHTDYFRLQAFFANTAADDEIPMMTPEELAKYKARKTEWESKTKPIRDQIAAVLAPQKAELLKEFFEKYPEEIQTAILKAPADRTPYEWQMYHKAKPYLVFDDAQAARGLKGANKTKYQELAAELKKFSDLDPGELPIGIGMRDINRTAPPTYRLAAGVWDSRAEEVQPGVLSILDPTPAKIVPPPNAESTGRRTALANWLTNPENPLPARVMVNRIWLHHFGEGIAASPSDFGMMGQRPTHPELLDWLATEFVRSGWDIKKMHKLIVMSNAYQQSSAYQASGAAADPNNKLLWRFPRQRLEGEVIRDSALAVSGLLNEKIGGPSVFPELPLGTIKPRGGWKVSDAEERNRRSVYIFVRRNSRYPLLETFDMPDTHESCGRRNVTIGAPQAMAMLNDKVSLEWAQAFAGRLLQAAGMQADKDIDLAYRLAYGRRPDATEKDLGQTFLAKQKLVIQERANAGEALALPVNAPAEIDKAAAAALVDFCHMLLNSNEFVYRN